MPEHLIRLRGPWWIADPDRPDDPGRRFPLPSEGPWPSATTHLLSRRFQAPPADPATESVELRLADVADLVAVRLNDQALATFATGLASDAECRFDLGGRLRAGANLLELVVRGPAPGPDGRVWGRVALAITARGE